MSDDRPLSIISRLIGCLAPDRARVVVALACQFVQAGTVLAFPWLIKEALEQAAAAGQWNTVPASGAFAVTVLALGFLARFIGEDQREVVVLRLLERLRNAVVARLMRQPAGDHVRSRSGDPVSKAFNDVQALRPCLIGLGTSLTGDLLRLAGAIVMLFVISWQLALVAFGLALGCGGLWLLTARWVRGRFHRVQAALQDMTSLLSEQARALPVIQAYGTTAFEQERFARAGRCHRSEALFGHRLHAVTHGILRLAGVVLACLVLGFALGGGATGWGLELQPEYLVGFGLYASVLVGPLNRLDRANLELQQMLAAARHLFAFLDAPDQQIDGHQPLPHPLAGTLRFEAVTFGYRPDAPVLAGLELTLRVGETTALVGPSGGGKSTLASLLLRFYEPQKGRILLDGQDLRELRLDEYRAAVGWLGQEPLVIAGTIAENIRYGCRSVTPAEVERAAFLACADEFIRELPRGYDTLVGERGLDLSGGQRSRLALARLVARSPQIVILDEATAALDADTETRLWGRLKGWLAARTVLLVAHRLQTVLVAPRIVVLDEGQVTGDGTAARLQTCPAFTKLFEGQMDLAKRAA